MSDLQSKEAGAEPTTSFDAVIVGAGFAGLYMLHRLRELGISTRVYEAGDGVGGTWYWNRYPGARCDIESMDYSFSFSDELQKEWEWTERYPSQPEILRYVNHVADRFNLRKDIQFNTRVKSAIFDETANRWAIETNGGEHISAQFCIMATGCLSTAQAPNYSGLDSFKGKWYHTGYWPHEGVDFTGQRVGVIGTGSSAIQSIPVIAEQAAQLFVFQRTPNFVIPAQNSPLNAEYEREFKAHYNEYRQQARETALGFVPTATPNCDKAALEVPPEVRREEYETRWKRGGLSFYAQFTDILVNKEANDTAVQFFHDKIRATVKDPAVAEKLLPKDHAICTKRLCVGTNYYETFNRENVTLVDIRSAPIEEITPTGLRTAEATYELDNIVFAIGFDAMTGAVLKMDIRGEGGKTLKEKWAEGPRTYLGLTTAEFPNLFTITGPGSPSVMSNMMVSIEQHVEWIADCINYLREHNLKAIEPTVEAEDAWVAHVNEVADSTLFPTAKSWYVGANIPGKTRIFMPYLGGVGAYRQKCDEVAANGYEGFALTK